MTCDSLANDQYVRERPILMSAPMVRATLRDENPKTQTRRVVKVQFGNAHFVESLGNDGQWTAYGDAPTNYDGDVQMNDWRVDFRCPYGVPGDRLWVRETWAHYQTVNHVVHSGGRTFDEVSDGLAGYRADGHDTIEDFRRHIQQMSGVDLDAVIINGDRWRPSIHMPRWASRITLEITDVRVERLCAISQEDCWAEGIDDEGEDYNDGERYASAGSPVSPERYAFTSLWESINGLRPGCAWNDNPWVWALTFKRVTP